MPGIPSRTFELEIAPLIPKALTGVPGNDIAPQLKELLVTKRFEALLNKSIVPLGLRWRVTPAMGLPRVPFSVFRRLRKDDDPIDVSIPAAQINGMHIGGGKFRVPSEPLYVLQIRVRNTHPTDGRHRECARPRESSAAAADRAGAGQLAAARPLPASVSRRILLPRRHVHDQQRGRRDDEGVDRAQQEWELLDVVGLPGQPGEISGYDATAARRSGRARGAA